MFNVQTLEYFPAQIFRDKDGPCPLIGYAANVGNGTTNNLVAAAVAGKKVRVISMNLNGNSATLFALLKFRSASAGSFIYFPFGPPAGLPGGQFAFNPGGWFETTTGDGLYVDGDATTACLTALNYIYFTP